MAVKCSTPEELKRPKEKIKRISDKAWESCKTKNPHCAPRDYIENILECWGGVTLHEDEYRTLSELASGSRLRPADDQAMAALDAENARLRQELNEMRVSRDEYARRERQLHAKEQSRPADPPKDVRYVKPFPDVAQRDDSFPAPSHRPRYIPFL